ncbi:MAG TPA: hypothetical protein VF744_07060 [Beijerinckiaceae bacterium]|jgi:hypothetical protein
MDIAERFRRLVGGPAAATAEDAPEDMRQHVRAAYALLCAANRRGIQVPADVVAVVTAARKADSAELPDDLEARFWNAYGLLASSIGPAARARTTYTLIFYGVLAVLLFAQFLFLAGDHVRAKMAEADARGRQAAAQVQVAPQGQAPTQGQPAGAPTQGQDNLAQVRAYHDLALDLVNLASAPLRLVGFGRFFAHDVKEGSGVDYTEVKSRLELILLFLSAYLLPMLYGLLGACAYVLRQLSDEIGKLIYAQDARVRYALRLDIGLLCGLAVGWFVRPGAGDAVLVSLSPFALAFVAGYGSELFFVLLDRIVQAFAPAAGTASTTVHATTAGGITATETTTIQKVVAGAEGVPVALPVSAPVAVPVSTPAAAPVADDTAPPDGAQGDVDRRTRPAADAPIDKAA